MTTIKTPTSSPEIKQQSEHFKLTMKVLPQAFPSLMGKLNLTTGGATDVSSVPLQSALSQIRLRISRLALYPV